MTITRFLRRPEVELRTGLSRSAIYARMASGEFPRPRRIGKRAVGWLESDVELWLSNCAEADPLDLHSPKRRRRTAETSNTSTAS